MALTGILTFRGRARVFLHSMTIKHRAVPSYGVNKKQQPVHSIGRKLTVECIDRWFVGLSAPFR